MKNNMKNKIFLLYPIKDIKDIYKAKRIYEKYNFKINKILFQNCEKNKKMYSSLKK